MTDRDKDTEILACEVLVCQPEHVVDGPAYPAGPYPD
jgi:hypothetical protein